MKNKVYSTLLVAILSFSGCGTIMGTVDKGPTPYIGTKIDSGCLAPHGGSLIWLCDLPFSFLADTAMLPVTLTVWLWDANTGCH